MLRLVQLTDRFTDIILLLLFILLFLIGGYTMYDTLLIYNASNGEDLRSYKPIITDDGTEWDSSILSDDVVAWLTVDDTSIDYPVLQGINNSEYLNKDAFGKYSVAGSIFLDCRNAPDFSDTYSLIYGHHMEYGHMFGALDAFAEKKYFDTHRTAKLIVGNKVYDIEFFACLDADGATREIFVPESAEIALQYVRGHSRIFYEPNGDKLIALSTCKFPETTERTIVFGTLRGET